MDTRTFFDILFHECAGYLEIRLIPESGERPERRFFRLPNAIPAAIALTQATCGRAHVFFGAYPRNVTRGRDESVAEVQGLYADLDAEHFPGGTVEIDSRLSSFPLAPTIVVGSGSGRHAYWLFHLPAPILPDPRYTPEAAQPGYAETRRDEVRLALWALADALGVPREKNAVHDLARVLRVPGTTNVKVKYERPLPCEVLEAHPERRYDPWAFGELAFAAQGRWEHHGSGRDVRFGNGSRWAGLSLSELLGGLRLGPRTLQLIYKGAPQGTDLSSACQTVITALVFAGCGPELIRAVFEQPEAGIGLKYHKEMARGNAEHWLAHSIAHAQAYIQAHNPRREGPGQHGGALGCGAPAQGRLADLEITAMEQLERVGPISGL